jgi:hypothetical protein
MRCCQSKNAAQGFLIPVNFLLSAGKPFIFCIYTRTPQKSLGIDLSNIAHHCTITWTDASITQVVRAAQRGGELLISRENFLLLLLQRGDHIETSSQTD